MNIKGSLLAVSLVTWLVAAANDSTKTNTFWIGYKMGTGHSDVSRFQRWAFSEGVTGIPAYSRNTFIGFEILYTRNRVMYGMSSEFDLRTFGLAEPYFFSFSFKGGYLLLDHYRFQVRSLAGIGLGNALVRFENGVPTSLQDIAANYSDPFARASAFIGRVELLSSFALGNGSSKNKNALFHPVLFISAGYQPVLAHGRWNFGENEPDIDGTRFVGQKIYMPRFYKSTWFASAGVAIAFTFKKS